VGGLAWELVHRAVTLGNTPTDVDILRKMKMGGEIGHTFFEMKLKLTSDVV
jgi:hypothetical protein